MLKRIVILPVLAMLVLAVMNCGATAPEEPATSTPATTDAVAPAAIQTATTAATATVAPITPLKGYDLAKLQGKVTFVELWGVWCPPCIRSMPHVQEMWEKYKGDPSFNLMVVNTGWRGDSPEKVKGWLAANPKYTFPVFYDDRPQEQQFATQNQVNSIPRSIILDKKGQVKYNGHPMEVPAGLIDKLLSEK